MEMGGGNYPPTLANVLIKDDKRKFKKLQLINIIFTYSGYNFKIGYNELIAC